LHPLGQFALVEQDAATIPLIARLFVQVACFEELKPRLFEAHREQIQQPQNPQA